MRAVIGGQHDEKLPYSWRRPRDSYCVYVAPGIGLRILVEGQALHQQRLRLMIGPER
jgi:hypothetical protein